VAAKLQQERETRNILYLNYGRGGRLVETSSLNFHEYLRKLVSEGGEFQIWFANNTQVYAISPRDFKIEAMAEDYIEIVRPGMGGMEIDILPFNGITRISLHNR